MRPVDRVKRAQDRRRRAYHAAEDKREEALCDLFNGFADAMRKTIHQCFDDLDRADRNYERAMRRIRRSK